MQHVGRLEELLTEAHREKDSLQFWNEFSQMVQAGSWLSPPCLSLLSGEMNLIKCQFCLCCMVSAFLYWRRNFLSFDITLVWSGIWSYEVYMERNLKVSFWKISKALSHLRLSLKVTSVQINKKDRVCLRFWEQELSDVFMANLSKGFLRTGLPHP